MEREWTNNGEGIDSSKRRFVFLPLTLCPFIFHVLPVSLLSTSHSSTFPRFPTLDFPHLLIFVFFPTSRLSACASAKARTHTHTHTARELFSIQRRLHANTWPQRPSNKPACPPSGSLERSSNALVLPTVGMRCEVPKSLVKLS